MKKQSGQRQRHLYLRLGRKNRGASGHKLEEAEGCGRWGLHSAESKDCQRKQFEHSWGETARKASLSQKRKEKDSPVKRFVIER